MCTFESHNAIKRDRDAFSRLEYVGEQPAYDDDKPQARLVMRNCSCGSTLSITIDKER